MNRARPAQDFGFIALDVGAGNLLISRLMINSSLSTGGIQPPLAGRRKAIASVISVALSVTRMI